MYPWKHETGSMVPSTGLCLGGGLPILGDSRLAVPSIIDSEEGRRWSRIECLAFVGSAEEPISVQEGDDWSFPANLKSMRLSGICSTRMVHRTCGCY